MISLPLVSKARDLLTLISEAAVCQGNSDDQFLALPNIRENSMKDAKGMLYSVQNMGLHKHDFICFCIAYAIK